MTKMRIHPTNLSKWLYQNGAEIIDRFDGCLLDNGLYQCKNGIAAIYAFYVNSNSSDYIVYFGRTKSDMTAIEDEFYTCMNA